VSFDYPLALVGLVLIPLFVALYIVSERRRRREAVSFGNPALLPNVIDRSPGWRRHLPAAILLAALSTMIVGVARPRASMNVPRQEAIVMLAVDTSRSMSATDVKPSRLTEARAIARRFIAQVPLEYDVALLAIGSRAITVVPPTRDRSLVALGLKSLRITNGTALADAIGLASGTARTQRSADGAIPPAALLMITDGEQNSGQMSLDDALDRVHVLRMPVYSMLVGTPDGQFEIRLKGGYREIIRVPSHPDTLQRIAKSTNGAVLSSNGTELGQVYEGLKSKLGSRRTTREITDLFAVGSALLLLCGCALSAFWFRRVI
jgi:Ca-activated chloride channel family protein